MGIIKGQNCEADYVIIERPWGDLVQFLTLHVKKLRPRESVMAKPVAEPRSLNPGQSLFPAKCSSQMHSSSLSPWVIGHLKWLLKKNNINLSEDLFVPLYTSYSSWLSTPGKVAGCLGWERVHDNDILLSFHSGEEKVCEQDSLERAERRAVCLLVLFW